MTQTSNDTTLDAALAIVRRRTPGEWWDTDDHFDSHNCYVWVPNLPPGIRAICTMCVPNCPNMENDRRAIVTAVNNFEALAERCKRAEARTGELITQCDMFRKCVEELTRQRDELLAACENSRKTVISASAVL